MSEFKIPNISIAGLPTIEFTFDGSLARAELAGAKLIADCGGDTDRANLMITDVAGELLADVMVRKMPADESITVSVMNVGSALLWSHARWVASQLSATPPATTAPAGTP